MELKEQLTQILSDMTLKTMLGEGNSINYVDQILALIKEAGYKSPSEVQDLRMESREWGIAHGKEVGKGEPPLAMVFPKDIKCSSKDLIKILAVVHKYYLADGWLRPLSDEELNKAWDNAFEKPINFDHKPTGDELLTIRLRAVAKAQREADVRYPSE